MRPGPWTLPLASDLSSEFRTRSRQPLVNAAADQGQVAGLAGIDERGEPWQSSREVRSPLAPRIGNVCRCAMFSPGASAPDG